MKSVILDTNSILRFLLADIPDQFQKVKLILKEIEAGKRNGYISILVINELIWALEKYYELHHKESILKVIEFISLKGIKILEIDKKKLFLILSKAIELNIDFVDSYILSSGKESNLEVATFDKKLLKNL